MNRKTLLARCQVAAVVAIVLALATTSQAQPITIPSGLNPGDSYRLAFVTSTTRNATSSNIVVYDALVTAAANSVGELASLGTTWHAIGSTTAVDARDHTNTNPGVEVGVPIFLLNDTMLVNDNADLWDGTVDTSPQIDETGGVLISVNAEFVWTGTATSGSGETGNELGSATVTQGRAIETSGNWIDSGGSPVNSSINRHLYGISGVLVVPVVTFVAVGTVDSVNPALSPTIQLGDTFRLEYSFDPLAVDANASANRGDYFGAVTASSITVGGYAASLSGNGNLTVFDNLSGSDRYIVGAPMIGGAIGGNTLRPLQLPLQLIDPTQTAFPSDALPVVPPSLGDFVSGGTFLVITFIEPEPCQMPLDCKDVIATATITSLTLGPVVQVPGLSPRGFRTLAILMVVVGGYAIKKRHRMRSGILHGFQ
jgi:hypothetical protein